MNTLVRLLAVISLLSGTERAGSVSTDTPLEGLAGDWVGELTYRDYQSDERRSIPVALDARLAADGVHLVAQLAFTDPGRIVRSLEVSRFETETGRFVAHSFSAGGVEREEYLASEREISSTDEWSLTFLSEGTDAGRAAELRRTRTLSGGVFVARTEVRYPDGGADWFVRNELSLARVAPDADPSALVGRWRVDLRPTPDADPYYATLEVTAADARTLEGTFYGAPVRDARVNVEWGMVCFAFTTDDGSGAYNTSARLLPDGSIEGTTHSLGREFLSVWTGSRD